MRAFFASLAEKCSVSLEFSGDKLRITGRGLVGIVAALAIVALILHFAPQFASLFAAR